MIQAVKECLCRHPSAQLWPRRSCWTPPVPPVTSRAQRVTSDQRRHYYMQKLRRAHHLYLCNLHLVLLPMKSHHVRNVTSPLPRSSIATAAHLCPSSTQAPYSHSNRVGYRRRTLISTTGRILRPPSFPRQAQRCKLDTGPPRAVTPSRAATPRTYSETRPPGRQKNSRR